MKFTILLASLLFTQLSFAQTEKAIKKDMTERTESMIKSVKDAREDLYREDPVAACTKIKEVFAKYPDHLTALGIRLDPAYSMTSAEALRHLTEVHKMTILCDKGANSEYVESKKLRKKLKLTLRSLRSQRKIIKKENTGYNNRFEYSYEF